MSFEFDIAYRYLKSSRKSIFTSLTSIIAIIAITLSVAAILITLGIINGFQHEIRQKILDWQAHITIYGEMRERELNEIEKKLSKLSEVKTYTSFILSQGILITETRSTGAVIKGIDKNEFEVSNIKKTIKYGDWKFENTGIVIGEELAKNLGVFIGDDIILISPKFDETGIGIIPKMKKFKVKGIINTGYYEYDSSFAFIYINDAQNFFNPGIKANGISIKLHNIDDTFKIYSIIRKEIPFYFSVKTYADINKNLFSALKLEKFVMGLILSLIILIATFSISSNLFLITLKKTREIGILRAIGVTQIQIKKIFLICGIYLSSIGITLGIILGSFVLYIIKKYKIIELPSDVYYITQIPVKISTEDVIIIILISFILTIISSILPSHKASKIDPVDAIRYG